MPRYLLDTHVVYWWMRNDRRLGKATRKLIAEEDCAVGVVTIWEMLLKNARGRLPLPPGSINESLKAQGFRVLPIQPQHVEATRALELVHNDPFDRLLLATAQVERLVLLTCDGALLALTRSESVLPIKRA